VPVPLPLFPLGLVLFPGVVLPLHVFEERYRALVGELLDLPEADRVFGVIAIRQGREVGADGVAALYDVGCTARIRRVQRYDDGRFDIVTTGATRFRLGELSHDRPYLVGQVDLLGEEPGTCADGEGLDVAVRAAFLDYLGALEQAGATGVEVPVLPDDPLVLSYLIGASVLVDLEDRQLLLAEPDGAARLRAALTLLRREVRLLTAFAAAPAPELVRTPISPN
jgi:Lon protease-like protein